MILTTWNVYKWNGSQWIADGTLPSPNRAFQDSVTSTATVTKLADGDICLERPTTKFNKKSITFFWGMVSQTEKAKLQGYCKAAVKIKLECKNASELYDGNFFSDGYSLEGEFLEVSADWVLGIEGLTQFYDITATFQPFEVD